MCIVQRPAEPPEFPPDESRRGRRWARASWSRGPAALLASSILGCAAPQAPAAQSTTAVSAPARSEVQRLSAMAQRQSDRITELEARIALLESEARVARSEGGHKLTRTVTIGRRHGAAAEADSALDEEPVDDRPPIRLRLHGTPRREPAGTTAALEPVPVVNERLPVVPLPGLSSGELDRAPAPPVASDPVDPRDASAARDDYRAALSLLQARDYRAAAVAFAGFSSRYPSHRLAASALYWEGEAHYALRAYREALTRFERVIDGFPGSHKTASALYKAGLCHRRLGDATAASRAFARLRKQFPDSELVARLSVEGSS